jgi:replicative DNA helicase
MEQIIIEENGKEYLEKNGFRFEVKSKCSVCGEVNSIIDAMGIENKIDCLCERVKKAKKRQEYLNKLSAKIVVPTETLKAFVSKNAYDEMFLERANTFIENFDKVLNRGRERKANGLIFSGNSGTGKTFIANCICNALSEKGYTYLDITLGSYLNLLRPPVKISEEELLEVIRTVDVLFIDDAGAEAINRDKEWAEEKLYRLFATRENGMKEFGNPTILTTNLTKEQLYKHLEMYGTTRISSRLNGIFRYGVRNEGKDRREEESELNF